MKATLPTGHRTVLDDSDVITDEELEDRLVYLERSAGRPERRR
jgi:hypothetical protein